LIPCFAAIADSARPLVITLYHLDTSVTYVTLIENAPPTGAPVGYYLDLPNPWKFPEISRFLMFLMMFIIRGSRLSQLGKSCVSFGCF
jgi:hypothetical protein